MIDKWDKRFLHKARMVSSWSKDPSTKVGAVIIGDKRQEISSGYNGFPRKIEDTEERLNIRELKYKYTIHAEANAIYNAHYNNSSVDGSTVYISGMSVCHDCAKAIIQTGIKRVVMDTYPNQRWSDSTKLALEMFDEAGIEYEFIGDV